MAAGGSAALDDLPARIDPAPAPGVRTLHQAVTASGAPFHAAVKYQMLMYALGGARRERAGRVRGVSAQAPALNSVLPLWGSPGA